MNLHLNDTSVAIMLISIAVLAATVAGLVTAMVARAAGSNRWAAALTGGAAFSAAMTLMLAFASVIKGFL
jgi:hypothetical protein